MLDLEPDVAGKYMNAIRTGPVCGYASDMAAGMAVDKGQEECSSP